jgi:SecY interacting protein Syd
MTSSNHFSGNKIVQASQVATLILSFSDEFISLMKEKTGNLPLVDFDEDWLSPCEQTRKDDCVHWQPVPITSQKPLTFDNLEEALEISLHPDIKDYFTTIYSEAVEAICEEGALSLLFAWNEDDFYRLQENIIGHILMKQKLKQAPTIFFAVTDEEDIIISIMNETGEVWVERVGCKPHKKMANSLSDFIKTLKPALAKDLTI